MQQFHGKFGVSSAVVLAAGTIFVIGNAPSHADVRYTMQTTMNGAQAQAGPEGSLKIRSATYLKDMRQRDEMTIDMGRFKMNTVTITQCDKHQEIKLDPELKIYTISPIGAFSPGVPPTPSEQHKESSSGKSGPGHVVMSFDVKDLGMEKLANVKARHYMVGMHTQSSGCAGDNDANMKMEIWTSPLKASLNCPERYTTVPRTIPNAAGHGCDVSYEMKGNVGALKDVFSNMMVKEIVYLDDKPLMTRELREHSTAVLDNALFDAPSDFKLVSDDEYSKKEQKAMMHNIMHGGGHALVPDFDTPSTDPENVPTTPADQPPPPAAPEHSKHHGFKMPHLPF